MGIFLPDGAVNGGGAKAVAGQCYRKKRQRAGKTVREMIQMMSTALSAGYSVDNAIRVSEKRSGADVWKRGHDRPGDRVYGPADGDEPSG